MPDYPVQPLSGFLRINQVLAIVPVGRSTWWRWVAQGKAPKPIKLGEMVTAWNAEDIADFLEKKRKDGAK